MRLEVIQHTEDFKQIREEWDGLLEKSSSKSIFLTWEWLYHWWKYFHRGKDLSIILARDNGTARLLGIAPLYIENRKACGPVKAKAIRLLGDDYVASDFLDCIVEPGFEKEFLKLVYDHFNKDCKGWDIWEMRDIDERSLTGNYLNEMASGPYHTFKAGSQICPYIDIPGSYEDLLDSLSLNMRKNLEKKTKKIRSDKRYEFFLNDFRPDVKTNVDILFNLHQARFEMKKKRTDFKGDTLKSFHYDVAQAFDSRQWLRLYSLRKEKEEVACLYSFAFKDCLYYYQSGFDPSLGEKSLGTVMFGYALQYCAENEVRQFHYLRGNEEYKKRWTRDFYRTASLLIINRTIKGRACYWYYRCFGLIKKIKKAFRENHG